MSVPNPTARPCVRLRASGPHWYAKWSRHGKPVVRALGRAWVESDGNGGWRRRRGKPADGALTEAHANARMLELVEAHHHDQARLEEDEAERRRRGVTFRELAAAWLLFLEREKSVKPSTLLDYGWMLAEPGHPHRRGQGKHPGLLMAALGDRPVAEVTTRQVSVPAQPRRRGFQVAHREPASPGAVRRLELRHARGHLRSDPQPCRGDKQTS